MAGDLLKDFDLKTRAMPTYLSRKPCFLLPFSRYGSGPWPRNEVNGEVMGVGQTFGAAFTKSVTRRGCAQTLGIVFLSLRDADKVRCLDLARGLEDIGFALLATRGNVRLF